MMHQNQNEKKEVKGETTRKANVCFRKIQKAAMKQKDIASKGAADAKAAIAAAKKDAAGPVRGVHTNQP